MKSKNIIWVVLVVAVIALLVFAGGGFNSNPKVNQPTSTEDSLKTNVVGITPTVSVSTSTVTYDGSSFSPAPLTVTSGTKVTFTNNSGSPMWIGSNPHPTHTDLPGFDSLRGLKKGESYSFTFAKVGSWGYHNHLSSSQAGTIVVQ